MFTLPLPLPRDTAELWLERPWWRLVLRASSDDGAHQLAAIVQRPCGGLAGVSGVWARLAGELGRGEMGSSLAEEGEGEGEGTRTVAAWSEGRATSRAGGGGSRA